MSLKDATNQPVTNDTVGAHEQAERLRNLGQPDALVQESSGLARRRDNRSEDLTRQHLSSHVACSRDSRDQTIWLQDRVALMRQLSRSGGTPRSASINHTARAGETKDSAAQPDAKDSNPSTTAAHPAAGSATSIASQSAVDSARGSRADAPQAARARAKAPIASLIAENSGPTLTAPRPRALSASVSCLSDVTCRSASERRPAPGPLPGEQKKLTWGANVKMVDGEGRFIDTVESAAGVEARTTAQRDTERPAQQAPSSRFAAVQQDRAPSLSERTWREHVPADVAFRV